MFVSEQQLEVRKRSRHDKKRPGAKSECLRSFFVSFLPEVKCTVENAKGIFTPYDVFKCKRAVCFSVQPFVLSEYYPLETRFNALYTPHVWGVCGKTATRATETEPALFLLCYQRGKSFISFAVVQVNELGIPVIDCDPANVTELLEEMKMEQDKNCRQKGKGPSGKKRGRDGQDQDTPESKQSCVQQEEDLLFAPLGSVSFCIESFATDYCSTQVPPAPAFPTSALAPQECQAGLCGDQGFTQILSGSVVSDSLPLSLNSVSASESPTTETFPASVCTTVETLDGKDRPDGQSSPQSYGSDSVSDPGSAAESNGMEDDWDLGSQFLLM